MHDYFFYVYATLMTVFGLIGIVAIVEKLIRSDKAEKHDLAQCANNAAESITGYPFLVTTTVCLVDNGSCNDGYEFAAFSTGHKCEEEICKSIEPIVTVCKEMGITGELVIFTLIEENDEYFDSDEYFILLAKDGSYREI